MHRIVSENKEKWTHGRGLVAEEESLVAEHINQHLEIVLAHLNNFFGRVNADARGAHLLHALRS